MVKSESSITTGSSVKTKKSIKSDSNLTKKESKKISKSKVDTVAIESENKKLNTRREISSGKVISPSGSNRWGVELTVPKKINRENLKNKDQVIITEKSEVANAIIQANPEMKGKVFNLGGNPFSIIGRQRVTSSKDGIRRSNKKARWRRDKSFNKFDFPEISKDTDVMIIADDDHLGHYIAYHVGRVVNGNIERVQVETNSPRLIDEIIKNKEKRKEYYPEVGKPYAATWYIEKQSELSGTITTALTRSESITDLYTKNFRKPGDTYTDFRQGYLQGTIGLNLGDANIPILGKINRESLSKKPKLILTLDTETGIREIEARVSNDVNNIKDVNFNPTRREKLKIFDTDETVLQLIDELKIESNQAESLIQRLASQDLISYPRTKEKGISRNEVTSNEELLDTWLDYAEIQVDREKALKEIENLREEKSKSGVLVVNKTNFSPETQEYRALKAIAELNLMAITGAERVKGNFIIEYDNNMKEESEEVEMINSQKFGRSVGQVVDVDVQREMGMTNRELFEYMARNNIGTVSTRSSNIDTLIEKNVVSKHNGQYKLDDRSRLWITALEQAEKDQNIEYRFSDGSFTSWFQGMREKVRDRESYLEAEKQLHSILLQYLKGLNEINLDELRSELERQIRILTLDHRLERIDGDIIQLSDDADPVAESNIPDYVELEISGMNYVLLRQNEDGSMETITGKAPQQIQSIDYDEVDGNVSLNIKTVDGKENVVVTVFTPSPVPHNFSKPEPMPDEGRGNRGLDAEKEVSNHYKLMGWDVEDVSHDRERHGDLRIKKGKQWYSIEVKELNQYVDSGDAIEEGRAQIEREYIKTRKKYIFKVNYANGSTKFYKTTGRTLKKKLEGKSDPAKLTLSQIEGFKEIKLK